MKRTYLLLLGLGLLFLVQAGGVAWSQVTERVSVDSAGAEGNNASTAPSNSSDGRYVAFQSSASNLVANDTNTDVDIFVRDRQAKTTTRVSLHTDGTEGNRPSGDPSISGDGRYVAFESDASTLVDGDMLLGGFPDIFVRDRDADGNGIYDEAGPGRVSTVRVSVDSDGIAWDGDSLDPSISANGRYVAFRSGADLVLPDGGFIDIYVHDRDADGDGIYDDEDGSYDLGEVSTVRVSVDSDGNEGTAFSGAPSISADGRYVAFESIATDLVTPVSNGSIHIFVHDRDADEDGFYDAEDGSYDLGEVSTTQVSVDSAGVQGIGDSNSPSISADGMHVAFGSDANNLVSADTNGKSDIFVHNLQTRDTTRVSVDSAGIQGNGDSNSPSISDDGRYVAFESNASNLVAGDGNGSTDVFVHDLQTGTTTRVSVDLAGVEDTGDSKNPSMSADGKSVTFQSDADNLVAGDTNTAPDIFFDDLPAAGEGGGSSSGGGGCFISTAADGSGMAGEK